MNFLSPLFIWTDAMLKGGKAALDSMQEVAKRSPSARIAVIPTADAPPRRESAARPNANARVKAKRKAKSRRR
jgi:hypothetical protein